MFRILSKFFSQPDLSEEIMRLEPIARAGVHLQLARRQITYGKKGQAAHHLQKTIKVHPAALIHRQAIEVMLRLMIGRGLYANVRRLRRFFLRLRRVSNE